MSINIQSFAIHSAKFFWYLYIHTELECNLRLRCLGETTEFCGLAKAEYVIKKRIFLNIFRILLTSSSHAHRCKLQFLHQYDLFTPHVHKVITSMHC
jgi:hypothetical protein